jgi:hypothetical protein
MPAYRAQWIPEKQRVTVIAQHTEMTEHPIMSQSEYHSTIPVAPNQIGTTRQFPPTATIRSYGYCRVVLRLPPNRHRKLLLLLLLTEMAE